MELQLLCFNQEMINESTFGIKKIINKLNLLINFMCNFIMCDDTSTTRLPKLSIWDA